LRRSGIVEERSPLTVAGAVPELIRGNAPQFSPDSLLAGPNRGTAHLYRP